MLLLTICETWPWVLILCGMVAGKLVSKESHLALEAAQADWSECGLINTHEALGGPLNVLMRACKHTAHLSADACAMAASAGHLVLLQWHAT